MQCVLNAVFVYESMACLLVEVKLKKQISHSGFLNNNNDKLEEAKIPLV